MKYFFIALFLILPFSLNAQTGRDTYTLLEPLPCVQSTGNDIACNSDTNTITSINTQTYILYLYRFSFSFAAALAVVMIIFGGFQYALSDAVFTKSEASSRIRNSVVGLLVLLGSYLILETIDPRLVEVKSTLDTIEVDVQKIDYGKFFGEIDTATQNRQLSEAMAYQKSLEEQAKKLEEQAAKETDPIKKQQALNDAINLRKEGEISASKMADVVAFDQALQSVVVKNSSQLFSSLDSEVYKNENYKTYSQSLDSYYAKKIELAKKQPGDNTELIQVLEKNRDYYTARLEVEAVTSHMVKHMNSFDGEDKSPFAKYTKKNEAYYNTAIGKIEAASQKMINSGAFTPQEVSTYVNEKKDLLAKIAYEGSASVKETKP